MTYINKNVFGEFALTGSIFLSCMNSPDFSDPYNLIYGHHMDNGGMFGDVMEFLDSEYFDEHKDWEKISVKNTAMAAQKIGHDQKKNQAAIAGSINADIYGLKVLENSIQDNKENSTRFIIVTNRKTYVENAKKISICFEIPHESGSLYHMLSHFIYNNLNMTRIQSRPVKDKNWEYRFFIDLMEIWRILQFRMLCVG